MIDVNETYLIEALVSVGVSEKQIERVMQKMGGFRIYVRDKEIERKQIIKFVCKKIKNGMCKKEAVDFAAKVFNKSERRIRNIIKDKCEKND